MATADGPWAVWCDGGPVDALDGAGVVFPTFAEAEAVALEWEAATGLRCVPMPA